MKPLPCRPGESRDECVARMKKDGTYYVYRIEYFTTHGIARQENSSFFADSPVPPEGDGWDMLFTTTSIEPNTINIRLFWFWKRTVKIMQAQLEEEEKSRIIQSS